ncbi:MAG: hypothetical protein GY798_07760 [Hyphomicrobiales bacterium]|nr:hypothetical protein [Hyphomicrobiales bacterium]
MNSPTSLYNEVPSLFRVYGITISSRFPFVSPLSDGTRLPDLTFALEETPPFIDCHGATELLFADPAADDYAVPNYIKRTGRFEVLRYTGTAEFHVSAEQITCCLHDPGRRHAVELLFLGTVLSWWLERAGRLAMHMSAVVSGNQALAFMSTGGGGKSSMAAALAKLGCPLLADDLVAIEPRESCFVAHPSYPQMRLWPDEADYFVGSHERFELAHPAYTKRRVPVEPGGIGTFCDGARELGCIYLPERRTLDDIRSDVEIQTVAPHDAFAALVGGAVAPRLADLITRRGSRLKQLAVLACQLPIRRVVYPSGMHALPFVAEAVLEDFSNVAANRAHLENV